MEFWGFLEMDVLGTRPFCLFYNNIIIFHIDMA